MLYYFFKGFEFIGNLIRIKCKIIYWKLKYGKRIKIGRHLKFRKRFHINITNDGYLEIGNNNFFNNDCSINCHKQIIIGDNNLFGESVKIYDHNHVFNNKNINYKRAFISKKIKIGNNNWIGTNVVILSKTTIKNNNVIAANLTVNEDCDSENILKQKGGIEKQKIIYVSQEENICQEVEKNIKNTNEF